MESVRRSFPFFVFFSSRITEGDQLIEIDVLPVGHFVDQTFGKDRETGNDVHLLGWFVFVEVSFENTSPGFFEAGL